MSRIVWSPQSLRDVEAIRAYIAEDSPHYADLMVRRIVAVIERLTDFPESGRIVPERPTSLVREVIVGRFRVVYRVQEERVEVVTVFRGTRRFPDVF